MPLTVERSIPLKFFSLNTDAKILNMMVNGDEEALLLIYRQNQKAVFSLVMKNNGGADDAEDVLQESVIVLWQRVQSGRFEYSSKLSTFVYAVAKNIWSRKRMRSMREPATDFNDDVMDSEELSPLDAMVQTERSSAVAAALEKLGEPCKTLLLLFYWEERSQEEIALQMGFANAATVKSKKYTCKKMLEQIIKGEGLHPDQL